MVWHLFDGNLFSEVHQIAGEWQVRLENRQISIRILVDRNNRYYFDKSLWPWRENTNTHSRGFSSLEAAVEGAIKAIRTESKK